MQPPLSVALSSTRKWRIYLQMQTQFSQSAVDSNTSAIFPALCSLYSPESRTCYDFVMECLNGQYGFDSLLRQLENQGCYSLRIDTGFDRNNPNSLNGAFLNEITQPADAGIFTHAHEADLIVSLANMFATGIGENCI